MPCNHCTLIIKDQDGIIIPPLVIVINGVIQNKCVGCGSPFSPKVQQLLDHYETIQQIKQKE